LKFGRVGVINMGTSCHCAIGWRISLAMQCAYAA